MSLCSSKSLCSPAGERGDVVLGWLTKVVATLAVLGLMGFDAVSLGAAHFRAEDRAQQAVRAAAENFNSTKNLQQAYETALGEVLDTGDTIDPASFTISPQGAVTLTLRHETATLLVEKIPPLRGYAVVDRTVTGRSPG
jgi:hypothetical protein